MNISHPKNEQIPELRKLWKEAFGDTDAFLDAFFTTAFSPNRCLCLVQNHIPLAALYWFDCEYEGNKIAYLYAIATATSHRGQGLCKQLMQYTHKFLTDLDYAGALLVPSDTHLFSFYETFGYESACHIQEFTCRKENQSLSLQEISPMEYSSLRRSLLPSGSIIQEQENLAFLQTQVTFYAGQGFILAAHKESDRVYCPEFLGDIKTAPGITYCLGVEEGFFRTYGTVRPFAMYLALNHTNTATPTYFGFAFD